MRHHELETTESFTESVYLARALSAAMLLLLKSILPFDRHDTKITVQSPQCLVHV